MGERNRYHTSASPDVDYRLRRGPVCRNRSDVRAPFEYVRVHVQPKRATNRQVRLRERWWLFEKPRPALRKAFRTAELTRFIATPMVSKHRLFTWLPV